MQSFKTHCYSCPLLSLRFAMEVTKVAHAKGGDRVGVVSPGNWIWWGRSGFLPTTVQIVDALQQL